MDSPDASPIAHRLIEHAAEILAESGPDALGIRRVATAAGTSTMAVYTHFGSKADLVRAVVARGFELLADHLAAVPITDDPPADLRALGRAYRAMALANANLYRTMFGRNPLGLGDPSRPAPPEDPAADPGLTAFGHLTAATRRVLAAAGIDPDRTEPLALGLWGLVHGCVDLELAGFIDDGEAALDAALQLALPPSRG